MQEKFEKLKTELSGDFFYDSTMRLLYATDASAYRELPTAVAMPKTIDDIKKLIKFATEEKLSIIPRAAGTSLAGQVVGNGIVVDVSRYMTNILEINNLEKWVRLQPGVIRDDLNYHLSKHGLYFGPETSTANRAMVGGMVGNNSCGSNSIVYGSTREHLLEVNAILSDGHEITFRLLTLPEFEAKCRGENVVSPLEQKIYASIKKILSNPENREEIEKEFPKKSITRRNTGYAIDMLMDTAPFKQGGSDFNFCKLIAGSEGTLAFLTEIKLNLVPLPPKETGLVCVHFNTIDEALRANLIALKYQPRASELIDDYILQCTKTNIEHSQNRFFVQGDPGALLVVELSGEHEAEIAAKAAKMQAEMEFHNLGTHFPVLYGDDTKKVWNLRKAGLGLLANVPGDAKPVPVIEDTAVDVQELPEYIRDFNLILKKYDLYSVHYAHAGSGELHLRPIINLKTEEGNKLFRTIAEEIAILVKKYRGSLSGEHGDGRLRGEFIKFMIGEKNYKLIEEVKKIWDPQNIFNSGKIVDTPSMNTFLRYTPGQQTPEFETVFDFSANKGILRSAELCNGSGDCRKTHLTGGTMCPSYMATRNERDTTRARANMLREMLTRSEKANRFDHKEILDTMDLCLSCKGCKAECPSNVDLAKLKAEFMQHYYDANGVPFRSRLIAGFARANKLAAMVPGVYNFVFSNSLTSGIVKKVAGFAPKRSMPLLHKETLKSWYKKNKKNNFGIKNFDPKNGIVHFFCDEFTNYNDTDIGIKGILLLTTLGYEVIIPKHEESGRAHISKGLLRDAKKIANRNIRLLKDVVTPEAPIVGVEPSAILTLRDEYVDLADKELLDSAKKISQCTLLFDEFISSEIDKGKLDKEIFSREQKQVKLHGHCHQKALSSLVHTKKMLSLVPNYEVRIIPSGCCGMAGSFGYEEEHYEVSMQIGELVLFPAVRELPEEVIIAAPGTSCRHQIKDGTGRKAVHPIEILYEALVEQ
ncbi:FAD-binding and (Fe-S)-binding domain-containing protein [soil metagenome]